ncbi:hypothetical protein ACSYAD_34520, partial [Acaryochloris marina NIES-2412]|uniref:hypothetical protein n=1 Tax=Acaryochloris marina TaxID=155978 RepID=UPI004059C238
MEVASAFVFTVLFAFAIDVGFLGVAEFLLEAAFAAVFLGLASTVGSTVSTAFEAGASEVSESASP